MLYTTLGRTGLRVSRMGLGCGGHARLGLARGHSPAEAERIVKDALALGINFIDTAEAYGTQPVVAAALAGVPRDRYVLSTKTYIATEGRPSTAAEFTARVEGCLQRLRTDCIDVFHLHAVHLKDYPHCRDVLAPAMLQLRDQGKIRHLGITEAFREDTRHAMLAHALAHDPQLWDVIMVGFNLLNPSARRTVLPLTQEHRIGTLCMYAVRKALSQPPALEALLSDLLASGQLRNLDPARALDFLTEPGVAQSIPEAAYRFALHEPGLDIILSGTGNPAHLAENARHLQGPPLPEPTRTRLLHLFGHLDSISGN